MYAEVQCKGRDDEEEGEKKERKQKRKGKRQVKRSAEARYRTGATSSMNGHLIKTDPEAVAMYGTVLSRFIAWEHFC